MIRLYELRQEKELTQHAIAKLLNIGQSTYCNWENGKSNLTVSQILNLAEFFGVTTDYLLGNSDDKGNIVYNTSYVTEREMQLLSSYRKMSVEAQQSLLNFIKNTLNA